MTTPEKFTSEPTPRKAIETIYVDAIGEMSGPETTGVDFSTRIARYRIDGLLGQGGFGVVYLAFDEQLNLAVAVKVSRSHPQDSRELEQYLAEARTLASLDHPSIVPVFDVGTTKEGLCYFVSKWIEGEDLATRLQNQPLSYAEAAWIVAEIAEALHHAHKQGIFHRDVKPANILLDAGM